jgi:hypothetical protein
VGRSCPRCIFIAFRTAQREAFDDLFALLPCGLFAVSIAGDAIPTGNVELLSETPVAVTGKYVHPFLKKIAEVVNQRNEAWREGAVGS